MFFEKKCTEMKLNFRFWKICRQDLMFEWEKEFPIYGNSKPITFSMKPNFSIQLIWERCLIGDPFLFILFFFGCAYTQLIHLDFNTMFIFLFLYTMTAKKRMKTIYLKKIVYVNKWRVLLMCAIAVYVVSVVNFSPSSLLLSF